MLFSCFNFKCYQDQTLELFEDIQAVIGNNGSGKSTLCEALSILVNAHNPHHTRWQEKHTFQKDNEVNQNWALRLRLGEYFFQTIYERSAASPKWYLEDQSTNRQKYENAMPYRAFWIQSDHLRVISGEPSERRNFLDEVLAFASPEYEKILQRYRTALTSRNKVIETILEKNATRSDLHAWDMLLAENAIHIIKERARFFQWLEKCSIDNLSLPGSVTITLRERHPLNEHSQKAFLTLLDSYRERDLVVGRTTV